MPCPALAVDRNELTAGEVDPVEAAVRGEGEVLNGCEADWPNGTPRSALAIDRNELAAGDVDAEEAAVRRGSQSGYALEAERPDSAARPAVAIDHDELATLGIGAKKSSIGREGKSPHIPGIELPNHTPGAACCIDDDKLPVAGVDAEERAARIEGKAPNTLETERPDGVASCRFDAGDTDWTLWDGAGANRCRCRAGNAQRQSDWRTDDGFVELCEPRHRFIHPLHPKTKKQGQAVAARTTGGKCYRQKR